MTSIQDAALASSTSARVLEAHDVSVHFQGVIALEGVDLSVGRGEVMGLIGPNGAGKTTLMNVLSGFQRPSRGRVCLDDRATTRWPPHRFARAGVARTFQSIRLFKNLTVVENVEIGAIACRHGRSAARRLAWDFLGRLDMEHLGDLPAGALSQGDERRVGILRALAMSPAFVLLDEPAAGLSMSERVAVTSMIAQSREEFSCGVLVIEHDMEFIMRLCERIQVIDHGRTICVGTPAEVRTDPAVRDAYLGYHDDRAE